MPKSAITSIIIVALLCASALSTLADAGPTTISFSGTVTDLSTPAVWCSDDDYFNSVPFTVSVTDEYTFTAFAADVNVFVQITTEPRPMYPAPISFDSYVGTNGPPRIPTAVLTEGVQYYFVASNACDTNLPKSYSVKLIRTVDLSAPEAPAMPEAPTFVTPSDNRINWQYGDGSTVVYPGPDNEGVDVYCYDGVGTLAMRITQEVVDNWDASQPQLIPVMEVNEPPCRAAFYILDNGQYQINIWSPEGKLYEMISDDLNFAGATKRYSDPNE